MMEEDNMYRKVAFCGLMIALAMLVSYVEVLVPIPIPVPGIKLGLANGVILFLLYRENLKISALVSILRVLLSSFLFGNMAAMIYSLSGALFSLLIMYVLKQSKLFSSVGVSMAGGVAHNIAQLVVAILVTKTKVLIYYLPVLMVAGVVTGFLIGYIMLLVNKNIRGKEEIL